MLSSTVMCHYAKSHIWAYNSNFNRTCAVNVAVSVYKNFEY